MDFRSLAYIKSDYYSALADYGYCHKEVYEQSMNDSDIIDAEIEGIKIAYSEIHGKGIFATKQFEFGDYITVTKVGPKRTIAKRYMNHHPYPNAACKTIGNGDIIIIAIADIQEGEEITLNYRQVFSIGHPLQIENVNKAIVDMSKEDRQNITGLLASTYDLLMNEDHIANMSLIERILAFEILLLQQEQVDIPVKHEFIDGLYRREIEFKKGTAATGAIHPNDHMDVIMRGKMAIACDEGYKIVAGPLSLTSLAGQKKAGIAIEDTVWASYHPTTKRTVEEVEKEIFVKDLLHIDVKGVAA